MGFSLDVSVPVLTVFVQGLLSFFSPCVLPLIPLYVGYLSGGTGKKGEDGRIHYDQRRVMLHTVCFVAGVSFAFFLLGLGASALGTFFQSRQRLFASIGGILVMGFGLYQLGIFGKSNVLGRERRLPFKLDALAMSPLTALIMGFTFSFAWTPCVGPAMTSVLLMAASSATKTMAFGLIGVYTLGFVLPFLAVGFFTTSLLEFFKTHMNVVNYTVKIGGVLMILMGVLMFTGKMNAFTGYLSKISQNEAFMGTTEGAAEESGTEENKVGQAGDEAGQAEGKASQGENEAVQPESKDSQAEDGAAQAETGEEKSVKPPAIPAPDFELTDQFGNTHTLEDYRGKTIFLNFWATWCPPCRAEMPDIQKLYEEYSTEGEEALIILGVATPGIGNETTEEGVAQFMEENGYTYPVLMDTSGELTMKYGISAYPTTFMIDREGNVFGYISGQLSEDMMRSIIKQTMDGKLNQS